MDVIRTCNEFEIVQAAQVSALVVRARHQDFHDALTVPQTESHAQRRKKAAPR